MSLADGRPNFLIITTDQHNPTCMGYEGHPVVRTPNIDALARSGTIFSRAYVTNPVCSPTRASLFTGLYPSGHRLRMNGIALSTSVPTFTQALRDSGYTTYCAGKIHLRTSGGPKGVPVSEVDPDEFTECSALWHSGRRRKLPSPYYGLDRTDYANGHGPGTWGEYNNWLKENHPDQAHLFFDQVALEPPGPANDLSNRGSFKWALPEELHPTHWIADRTIDFLNEQERDRRSGDDKPFMAWCSIPDPHSPFTPPQPYGYKYREEDVPPPLRDEGEFDRLPPHFRAQHETSVVTSGSQGEPMGLTDAYRNECAAHYYGLIEMIDDNVGRVLQALHDKGLADNTVVIMTADHGEALGDHGMWGKGPYHYDSVVRAPFLVSWPGHYEAGRTHGGPISLVDFAPTILDVAGAPIPEGYVPPVREAPGAPPAWPGRSLVPVLTGEDLGTDTSAMVEDDQDYLGFRMRTVVTERYRLTAYSGQPYGELFDFQEDPHEFFNRWDDPAYKTTKDDLRIQLLDKMMESSYPLPRQHSRS